MGVVHPAVVFISVGAILIGGRTVGIALVALGLFLCAITFAQYGERYSPPGYGTGASKTNYTNYPLRRRRRTPVQHLNARQHSRRDQGRSRPSRDRNQADLAGMSAAQPDRLDQPRPARDQVGPEDVRRDRTNLPSD
jgi:hypothetical protein